MDLKHLTGAVLVIGACLAAGLKASRELAADVGLTERLRRTVLALRTEICLRKQPLPTALSALEKEFIVKEHTDAAGAQTDPDMSFSDRWGQVVCTMGLPREAQMTMFRLGADLSGGEPPENAFAQCEKSLEELLSALREKQSREGKTYVAMGLCAGVMLAILLI